MRQTLIILRMHLRNGTLTKEMILDYIIGTYRVIMYWLHPILVPFKVRLRYIKRYKKVNPVCRSKGSCENCGCSTKGKLMTKTGCEYECYGEIN